MGKTHDYFLTFVFCSVTNELMETVNERIVVGVEFALGKVTPRWFGWRGREYQVKRVPMVFERKDGGRRYICFNVTTDGMIAELSLDTQNFQFSITNFQPITPS
ncbi:MAG TPA: hypothetical protein VJ327_04530 [Patescibacteria group bacterium]|nr:hypothetical protein [Patescibacteria group bacterium]